MHCAFLKGIQVLKRHVLLKTIPASELLSHTVGVLVEMRIQVRPR